jgi:hypothetical protein
VPAIHAVRRIGVHARRSHQHRRQSVFDSLISLPAFLLTPRQRHTTTSRFYWGVSRRALRQVKLLVGNVAAGRPYRHVETQLRLCEKGMYPHAVLSFPSSAGGGEVRYALPYEAMRHRLSWTEMRGPLAFRA